MATPITKDIDNLPIIALVGRVNVGKSTLFNRLIEEKKAIVSDMPGTTRTSNEGLILWRGRYARLIDTGGLSFDENVPLEKDIIKQTEAAIARADLIVLVADADSGIRPQEKEIAKRLRAIRDKSLVLAVNKADNPADELKLAETPWTMLGLGEPLPISAVNGRRVGDFLDHLFHLLSKSKRRPKAAQKEKESAEINVAIIGKPNVGKSSLFNKIIGEEKVIVSPMPHTTREPHDTNVIYEYSIEKKTVRQPITFLDTAGIRRKANVSGALENMGIQKSIRAAESSDIILFVLDGTDMYSSQDRQLGGLLEKRAKSVIILVNKWDLAPDMSDTERNKIKRTIYSYFPHLDFAPILFVSGLTGYRVHDIFPLLLQTWRARHTEIPQPALDQFLKQTTSAHRPSRGKGTRHPEIVAMTQLAVNPPVFQMSVKYRTSVHPSYVHFVERRLREQFDFFGTPIILKLTKMKR